MDGQCLREIKFKPREGITKLGETKFSEIHYYYYLLILLLLLLLLLLLFLLLLLLLLYYYYFYCTTLRAVSSCLLAMSLFFTRLSLFRRMN